MPTGREIMERAGILLNDEEHVRWTLPEICDWINEAQRAIVLVKPSASSKSIVLTLVAGTKQTVPQAGDPKPLMLVSIVRNLKSAATLDGGRIITATNRALLDAQEPNWHDKRSVPFRREARHFVYDEAVPLEFYVYPGNDGTGIVEAQVSTLPAVLAATGDVNLLSSYAATLDLPEPYSVPILDYVLYRCQMKDAEAGDASRAAGHYQQFASAIGMKIQVEGSTSPNTRRAK